MADYTDETDPKVLWKWIGEALRPWVGWILIAAGAICMLVGYLGVSRESLPAKQIPYLVSGGIGGIFDLNSDERCKGCWSIGSLISPSMTSMRASRPRWRPPLPRREPPPSS